LPGLQPRLGIKKYTAAALSSGTSQAGTVKNPDPEVLPFVRPKHRFKAKLAEASLQHTKNRRAHRTALAEVKPQLHALVSGAHSTNASYPAKYIHWCECTNVQARIT